MNKTLRNSDFLRPFRDGQSLSAITKNPASSGVAIVFFAGHPSTVIRAVSKGVVDAINLMCCRWSMPHVGQKICKGIPALAHRYSTTSISPVVDCFRVAASLPHARPNIVRRGMPLSMNLVVLADSFALVAAATIAIASRKGRHPDNFFCPTGAATKPERLMLNDCVKTDNCEATKDLTHQISDLFAHRQIVPQNNNFLRGKLTLTLD